MVWMKLSITYHYWRKKSLIVFSIRIVRVNKAYFFSREKHKVERPLNRQFFPHYYPPNGFDTLGAQWCEKNYPVIYRHWSEEECGSFNFFLVLEVLELFAFKTVKTEVFQIFDNIIVSRQGEAVKLIVLTLALVLWMDLIILECSDRVEVINLCVVIEIQIINIFSRIEKYKNELCEEATELGVFFMPLPLQMNLILLERAKVWIKLSSYLSSLKKNKSYNSGYRLKIIIINRTFQIHNGIFISSV